MERYKVVGYDKDGDVYVPYEGFFLFKNAVKRARELAKLVKKDELRRKNGEPIDWIQIYKGWGTCDEAVVWGSYLEKEEVA